MPLLIGRIAEIGIVGNPVTELVAQNSVVHKNGKKMTMPVIDGAKIADSMTEIAIEIETTENVTMKGEIGKETGTVTEKEIETEKGTGTVTETETEEEMTVGIGEIIVVREETVMKIQMNEESREKRTDIHPEIWILIALKVIHPVSPIGYQIGALTLLLTTQLLFEA